MEWAQIWGVLTSPELALPGAGDGGRLPVRGGGHRRGRLLVVLRQQHGVDDVHGEGGFFGHRLGHPDPSAARARRPQPHCVPVAADGDGVALVGGRVGGQRAHRHPVERLEMLPAVARGGARGILGSSCEYP